jgi:DNA (cytosine-5)-methyltransferase 1
MLKVLDLFSGIGGFSLGLERTGGFETVAFCEIEDYPRRVLAKHWPDVPIYKDVRNVTGERLATDGIAVDVITGGFPCQDISQAGRQSGIGEGTRSGLWSEIARLVGELRPKYVIVENVAALLSGPSERRGAWFGRVLGDLAEIGYDAEWHSIPASSIGAKHHRDRVWIIAYPQSERQHERDDKRASIHKNAGRETGIEFRGGCEQGFLPNANSPQRERERLTIRIPSEHSYSGEYSRWKVEPRVGRVANGVPNNAHRLKALGNAVVPQIPEMIGYAILESK